MGTGTFLVEIIQSVAETIQAERQSAATPKAHLRELFARRLVGFELQVAPYAVAELRLHHTLKRRYGVEIPREEVRFLSNALEDPDTLSIELGELYEVLRDEREGANRIKRDIPVMVVIGNPPWRERARGKAPWIETPRDRNRPTNVQYRPSLDEFKALHQSKRTFNLSNMWVYFWRWALWKAFEANPSEPTGVVTLITPRAYVTSEAYAGMRRYLRETADEGWIIDLSPEDFRPDAATRPFPGVQQPICIATFVRYGRVNRRQPAMIRYTSVAGLREAKFAELLRLEVDGPRWGIAPAEWEAPLRPLRNEWASFPAIGRILPWHRTGVNANRSWVWSPDPDNLVDRWQALIRADPETKRELIQSPSPDRICLIVSALPL
jgi:hypothetical protein